MESFTADATVSMDTQKRRKQFCLEEKLSILEEVNSGKKKVDVAKKYGISKSTLSTILKDSKKLEEQAKTAGFDPKRRRMRTAQYDDIDKATLMWLQDVRSKNIPVTGPLLRERALHYAGELGHDDFRASEGWLARFRNRYGVRTRAPSDEVAPVSKAQEWTEATMKSIIAGEITPQDVYKAAEAALVYQLLSKESSTANDDPCKKEKSQGFT
ncbi:tigger transposable element-derived protein 6 [Galendromus occidentalis]|uniref:Tigger transposable element-derived protein 6 n=1 Tax=Galendromus occidentalis TaxID=34638 RepID=A0AAJ7WJQ9_9ACAR|nr:tigger transposable element-derived protein 6 [Galendromus occidentalis]